MKVDGRDTVWCVVMFDLPVQTKKERREATKFRKLLVETGFSMIQFSVYGKYSPTVHDNMTDEKFIKNHLPCNGEVRIFHLTDVQWAKATRYLSKKKIENEETPEQISLF